MFILDLVYLNPFVLISDFGKMGEQQWPLYGPYTALIRHL